MRKYNKLMKTLAVGMIAMSLLAGCGEQPKTEGTTQEVQQADEKSETSEQNEFKIFYPDYAKEKRGDALVLKEMPSKIICLSNTALGILADLDIKPIAITSTVSGEYPDWVNELPKIETGMSKLDTESVIAMQPDLVIMGNHLEQDFGQVLTDAGIPIYYTSEGHGIAYKETKEQAIAIAQSFGGEEEKEKINNLFQGVEDKAKQYKEAHQPKKAMILFTTTYQSTSKSYLGSMLEMLGFENISDTMIDPSMMTAPLDMEQLMNQNPDVIFALYPGVPTNEMVQKTFEEEFTKNPEVWEHLSAIKDGKIIYLSGAYATAKGLNAVEHFDELINKLEETLK